MLFTWEQGFKPAIFHFSLNGINSLNFVAYTNSTATWPGVTFALDANNDGVADTWVKNNVTLESNQMPAESWSVDRTLRIGPRIN
jgi:hypothetical protein